MTQLADALARARREGWADQVRTAADERALIAGCHFDLGAVAQVVGVLETFRLSVGAWAGRTLELLEWQIDRVIGPFFGWRTAQGLRRFRELQLWIAKKNGKTTLIGALGIYFLAYDGEAAARLGSFAFERDQASLGWDEAVLMIQETPHLRDQFVIVPTDHLIAHPASRSEWKVYPKGSAAKEGKNLSGVLIDEMHVISDPQLLPTLRDSGAARRQPVRAITSTAGEDLESVGGKEYLRARRIALGELVQDDSLVVIYEADPDRHAAGSLEAQRAANPSLGSIIQQAEIAAAYQAACGEPDWMPDYLRYRENRWVASQVGGLDLTLWDACPVEDVDLGGRPCFGGIDLASRRDMCAFSLLFPPVDPADLIWHVLVWYWIPSALMEEPPAGVKDAISRETRVRYRSWIDAGMLQVTEGKSTDYGAIRTHIKGLGPVYDIQEVDVDRYEAAKICQELKADGFDVVEVGQGTRSLSAPSKELRDVMLPEKRINHRGHPVLRYNVQSAVFVRDAGGMIKPIKANAMGKIDGLMTLLTSLSRALVVPVKAKKKKSAYDGRGLVFV